MSFGPLLTLALFSAVMLVGQPSAVKAAPVTVAFGGTVTDDPFGFGFTTFTGSYTYDPASVDASPDASTGSYTSIGPEFGIQVSFDGGAATPSVLGSLNIGIANDFAGPVDQYTVSGLSGTTELGVFLEDPTALAFSSDNLPAVPPLFTAFSFHQLRWFDVDAEVLGRIETLSCVLGCGSVPIPEPGTGTLVGLAVLGAFLTSRRHRRR